MAFEGPAEPADSDHVLRFKTARDVGTGGPSAGLTDTQLRATPVPVSVSQATPGTTNGVSVKNLKGEAGAVVETGTTAISGGDFEAIQCLADTVLASYTSSTLTGDSLAGVTLPAGTIIYARFSAFTLTSGKVIAYNRAP